MQASALLLRWGSYHWARNLWVLIIYLFFLPVMLPSVVPRLATDSAVRVFPGVWKPLFFKTPFPGPSSSGDQVFGEHSPCGLSPPPPSLLLGFLGVQPAHLVRWMLTVQNPMKSWLAMKPACSLVDNASLGHCPFPALAAYHRSGMACSRLSLFSPLFCEWTRPDGVFNSVQFSCPFVSDDLRLGLFPW